MINRSKDPLVALGGPALVGAIVGARGGTAAFARDVLLVPGVIGGVTLLMLPALYIGASLVATAPAPAALARTVGRALAACGVLLLGLAAPAAFLLATIKGEDAAWIVGALVLASGGLAALRVVYVEVLDAERASVGMLALFTGWAIVALAMGFRLCAVALEVS
jgi:hypothetical protein